MSEELPSPAETLDLFRKILVDAADLARQFALAAGELNPATAALAFRIAAEHAEFQLRLQAGEAVFDGYVSMRDQFVLEATKSTAEKMLGKLGARQ